MAASAAQRGSKVKPECERACITMNVQPGWFLDALDPSRPGSNTFGVHNGPVGKYPNKVK